MLNVFTNPIAMAVPKVGVCAGAVITKVRIVSDRTPAL